MEHIECLERFQMVIVVNGRESLACRDSRNRKLEHEAYTFMDVGPRPRAAALAHISENCIVRNLDGFIDVDVVENH